MKYLLSILTIALLNVSAWGQNELEYYLPMENFNPEIPEPAEIIGHQVGEWHVSHDKLVHYMYAIAESSDRISIHETGKTFEGRPLLLLTITSPSNHEHLEDIRTEHLRLTSSENSGGMETDSMPVVVYMGFSIHGNEPSGSNASLLTAYYLAASNSTEVRNILDNTVILFDPSFNPDGLQRFASWVNSRKSQVVSSDPQNQEQNEPWPRGRTNHYWFDLNRDWLPAQLPESQARLKTFHAWKPNVLTDHHEMGTNSTFFFQPGIPSRNNPLTPERTYELTEEIGKYHARALDSIGSLYYTKESYDDFYYGKGSSYPDVNGGIGILFEQASSRGHSQESDNGILTFAFTIKNQFNTTLSTLRAANGLREELLNHQQAFYSTASTIAGGYLVSSEDPWLVHDFAELLGRHQIQFRVVNEEVSINGNSYPPGQTLAISFDQPQHRLITSIFERRTSFTDSLFYDVSAWNLAMSFNMDYEQGAARTLSALSYGESSVEKPRGGIVGGEATYAYVIPWDTYYSPAVLNQLQQKGLFVKTATSPFNGANGKQYKRGTILVPVNGQKVTKQEVGEIVEIALTEFGIRGDALNSGLDFEGKSLGSPSFEPLTIRKTALLVGNGVSSYEAGEVWHLFDERMKIPLTLLPVEDVSGADLSRYNTIIMVDGSYGEISGTGIDKLKDWVRNGGILITVKRAVTFAANSGLGNFEFKKGSNSDSAVQKTYSKISAERGAQQLGGAIFEAKIDLTNPLFYGYTRENLALFKDDRLFMQPSKNGFANPAIYTQSPVLAGYISEENLELLKGSSAVGISRLGRGRIVAFTNDLNFRAFWRGTNRIFLNAVFLSPVISSGATR